VTATDLTDVREELRQVARTVIAERCASAQVRALTGEPLAFDPELWRTFAELGWLGLEIDEEHGGAGMSFAELAVVLEELGRGLVPAPFLATVVLGAAAIAAAGDDEQRRRWLPGIAGGSVNVTVALDPPERRGAGLHVERRGDRLTLHGACRFVPDAGLADALVIDTDDASTPLLLVAAGTPGMTIVPSPVYDQTRRLGEVRFDHVTLGDEHHLGTAERAPALRTWLRERAAAALALDSLGGARRALEVSVEYAKERVQFGRAIGSFQAVKHRCADMLVAVETARVAVDTAVRELPRLGGPPSPWVPIAKSHATEAYTEVAGLGIAVLGGIGFTWEHDMHLFLKRAQLNQALYGTPAWHRDELVRLLAIREERARG
jgi:alkylation response protein AidB-like acyl-CoA dehydrogenase